MNKTKVTNYLFIKTATPSVLLGVVVFKFAETIFEMKNTTPWYKPPPNHQKNTMWRFYNHLKTRYNCDTRLMREQRFVKQLNSNYGLVKNPVCCLTIQSKLCEWRTEVSRDEGGANRADFSLRSKTYRMDNNPQRY